MSDLSQPWLSQLPSEGQTWRCQDTAVVFGPSSGSVLKGLAFVTQRLLSLHDSLGPGVTLGHKAIVLCKAKDKTQCQHPQSKSIQMCPSIKPLWIAANTNVH